MRRLVVLVLVATTAACGQAAVSPLPVDPSPAAPTSAAATTPTPPTPAGSATATPPSTPPTTARSTTKPAPTRPTTRPPAKPTTRPPATGDACLGAVRYEIDTNDEVLVRSLCLASGAVLRIRHIGPGLVTADPADLVSQHYEAGIVDIRFLRAGTVTVTIPRDNDAPTVTVVVK